MSCAHDKKRAKSRKKETRLCVRRTFDNIITYFEKKSYKKVKKIREDEAMTEKQEDESDPPAHKFSIILLVWKIRPVEWTAQR